MFQENGVKYRVLKLKKEKGANGCPSEKKMSKKCRIDKKKNLDKKKKSKKGFKMICRKNLLGKINEAVFFSREV